MNSTFTRCDTPSGPRIGFPGRARWLAMATVGSLILGSCGGDGPDSPATTQPATTQPATTQPATTSPAPSPSSGTDGGGSSTTAATSGGSSGVLPSSEYLGDYELSDDGFGTKVTVTVGDGTRKIVTNALPNHKTGEFPNEGNPNSISAQDLTWELPTVPKLASTPGEPRVPGVAVNGIKFEPGTAETVSCASGERFRVEAVQEMFDLGLDFNNAHVQPTGEYHYHGVSELLVKLYESDADLVHVGFAADGHLIYFSKSGAFTPAYRLDTKTRTGTECEMSLPGGETFDTNGTKPDGTYTSDWVFDAASGNLDECNGATVGGTYAYFITDTFPYVSRCLKGEFTEEGPPAGAGGMPPGAGPPPPAQRPGG